MYEFLQVFTVALYLVAAYAAVVVFVWLITRDEPALWMLRDLALKPIHFLLSPFGVTFTPQASRPEVEEALKRERTEEASTTRSSTNQFRSIRAAKEYLVRRIAAEAEREGMPLTEAERKMLCFSDTGSMPPGILKINEQFECDCDPEEYENKIAGIIRNLQVSATPDEQETWDDAVLRLCDSDHYLLVLIDGGSGRSARLPKWLIPWLPLMRNQCARKRGDMLRLLVLALIFVGLVMGVAVLCIGFK